MLLNDNKTLVSVNALVSISSAQVVPHHPCIYNGIITLDYSQESPKGQISRSHEF